MGRRGINIIELIIAASLFLLALTVVGQLAVMGVRSKKTTEDKNAAYRMGTNALDQLNRDLAHCEAIYLPAPFTTSQLGITHPAFVIRTESSRSGSMGPAVVGYSLDRAERNLLRVIYDPAFDPAVPSTQIPAVGETIKTEAQWVENFTVSLLNPAQHQGAKMIDSQLRISTVYKGNAGPALVLTTRTRLRQL